MSKSKIEWTERTWNPVTGCTKVSTGCKNCYAETIAKRFWGDRKFTDVELHENRLSEPLKRKKPTMYFVNSMSDLFHEDVPFDFIRRVFFIMSHCKQHTFQVLTKRPERMKIFILKHKPGFREIPEDNIWLGVSVENQKTADERIPLLLQTPAAVRWISAEPLLGKIDLKKIPHNFYEPHEYLDWVVVGGESGPKRRPFNTEWARSIRDQCKAAKVPFFMKQIDKVKEIPEDLMIREYPNE